MPKSTPTNWIALAIIGILIALIGMTTLLASRLISRAVVDQFRSQEIQLVSSLSQQTETYFSGLNAAITSLSLQPAIRTVSSGNRSEALLLMQEQAAEHAGIIDTIIRFDNRGQPRYAWPAELSAQLAGGSRPPYGLPSRLVAQTQNGGDVPLEVELLQASHRDKPEGTFLLVAPVYTGQRKTEYIVYELNLDELFSQVMIVISLDSTGQLWVIDSANEVLFQANPALPVSDLFEAIPPASLLSFRQPATEEYGPSGENRLAAIAPVRTHGNQFVVILSRTTDAALEQVEADLRLLFVLSAGVIILMTWVTLFMLRRLSREARRRQEEELRRQGMRTLLEVSRALNSTLDLQDVLQRIMTELYAIVPYDSAVILLVDRSQLVVAAHRGALDHASSEIPADQAHAANQVIQLRRPLVINDTVQDERWTSMPNSPIRAWMGIPLRARDRVTGVLNINSHTAGRFSPEEVELAEAFADQASVALQNARLHEFEVTQIEQELNLAREIQTTLLPSTAPEIPQLEIAAYSQPARQVSGDYFQYLAMPGGHLGIAVGDVSGKGIPAAMLMAMITTAMRDEAARNARPADLLNALNLRLLDRMKTAHVNSALMVGMFDPPTRHFEIANGGMVQPYVRNGKDWSFIPVGGYPLGVSQRLAYTAKTVTLAPGSMVLMISDGVIEALNPAGEMYGFDRLEVLLNSLPRDISAQTVIDRVLAAVRDHLAGEEPQDDLTIVALRSLEVAASNLTPKGEEA